MSDALAVVTALRDAISQERSDAVESVRVERLAWARLVKAESGALMGSEEAREAARQALRDLGVDVDAMMEET